MKKDNDFYWYWFVNIPRIGQRTKKKLLEAFFHPVHIFQADEHMLRDFLDRKQMTYFLSSRNTNDIEISMERLRQSSVRFIHWESEDYPDRLRRIFDPPYGFYLRGKLPEEKKPALGMIGSRKATTYGRKMAAWFAKELSEKGVQIISGLASGIDTASHRGALWGGGYTAGILGGGIDTIYPRENFNLYMEMYQKGGVLSEYNLGIPNHPGLFPLRNRLISGLSDAVFVLEAGERSGTFITVDQALEQGKEVFALPGRVTDVLSAGCNRLVSEGAIPVFHPEDVLELLFSANAGRQQVNHTLSKAKKRIDSGKEPLDLKQKKVYQLLDEKEPVSVDMLVEQCEYTVPELSHILYELEINGLVFQPNQNVYLKKPDFFLAQKNEMVYD